jgi:protein-disulfide isomerase
VKDQGVDKFWKFHDIAFKHQDKLDPASLEAHAKAAGADMAKFKSCMDSKKFSAQVDEDTKYGEKIGVRSTPTFFVNGQMMAGAMPIDSFSEVIDEELDEAKKK